MDEVDVFHFNGIEFVAERAWLDPIVRVLQKQMKTIPLLELYQEKSLVGRGTFGDVYQYERDDYNMIHFLRGRIRRYCRQDIESGLTWRDVLYISRHLGFKAHLAVKVVKEQGFLSLEELELRKREEANLIKLHQRQNIVRFFGSFQLPNTLGGNFFHYLMEYCEGNLGHLCSPGLKRELDAFNIERFVVQILRGLDYMHRNNLWHKNLKPENVLLHRGSPIEDWATVSIMSLSAQLCDLGLSKSVFNKSNFRNQAPKQCMAYLAPEVAGGQDCDKEKADMFSVGVLTFELGHKRTPMPHEYQAVQRGKWHRLSRHHKFGKWTLNMLQGDPDDRPRAQEALNNRPNYGLDLLREAGVNI